MRVLATRADAREWAEAPVDAPVLVPGIVFDRQGHRIGYGGGYFDRFLAGRHGLSVGLAFAWQVVEEIPRDAHDVAVAMVVTEAGVDFRQDYRIDGMGIQPRGHGGHGEDVFDG